MISMYTGSVGSGKSYHALHLGVKVINEKKYGQYRYVIANFPLLERKEPAAWLPRKMREKRLEKNREEHERWIFNDEITIEYLIAESIRRGWYGKESMCMVIIDEAGIIFNSRDWQTQGKQRNNWIKFLALSRKFGYDFIFVAQADRMMDKQIRGLCEYEVKHLKANNSFFMSFLTVFRITVFMYIYQWYQTKMRGNLRFGLYRDSIGARYDTMRIFNFDDLIDSVKALYDGKIIPAPVAMQINLWSEEKIKRALEAAETEIEQRRTYEGQEVDILEASDIWEKLLSQEEIDHEVLELVQQSSDAIAKGNQSKVNAS